MKKTTEEVFKHHLEAFSKKDLKEIASDFTDQSIYINCLGVKVVDTDEIMKIYKFYFDNQEEGATSKIKSMYIEGDIVFHYCPTKIQR